MASSRAREFAALHRRPGRPLLMPNPWDAGAAKLLAAAGFEALATTSSGFAATLGRRDGGITREHALAHAAAIVAAVDVPVSADLEYGFAHDPAGVAETVALAVDTGLAGCSIEDYSGTSLYDADLAVERIAAAAAAARRADPDFVLTARAENHIRGNPDLADTIARLRAYVDAGADVVFAPGVSDPEDIRSIVSACNAPVNVLALPGVPPVDELARLGVARVSVGGSFTWVAYGAALQAGRELLEYGTYGYLDAASTGGAATRAALDPTER